MPFPRASSGADPRPTPASPVAVIFWVWAVVNCINKRSLDLGAVSFLTVILAALATFHRVSEGLGGAGRLRWLMGGACAFVTLNYGLGLGLVDSTTLRLYFGAAAVCWAVAGVAGVAWLGALAREGAAAGVRASSY